MKHQTKRARHAATVAASVATMNGRERRAAKHRARLDAALQSEARRAHVRSLAADEMAGTVADLAVATDRARLSGAWERRGNGALAPLGFAQSRWGEGDAPATDSGRTPYDSLRVARIEPNGADLGGWILANGDDERVAGIGIKAHRIREDGLEYLAHVNPSAFTGRVIPALEMVEGGRVQVWIDDTAPGYGDHVEHGVRDPRSSQSIRTLAFTPGSDAHERRRERVAKRWRSIPLAVYLRGLDWRPTVD